MQLFRPRYNKIFKGNSQALRFHSGQATIELTLGLLACFILFLCTIQFFIWINRVMVEREEWYEGSRLEAGGAYLGPLWHTSPGEPSKFTQIPEFIPD